MQAQQQGRFRRFLQTPVGKAILIAFAIAFVFAATAYVTILLAIPAMLLTGLAVPIWAGLKRPRYLALSGLVVLLLVAPLANVALTQELMTPIAPVSSSNLAPVGNGGSVLQNASVSPYVGGGSTNFTWTVTVAPRYVPGYPTNATESLSLFVSSCPGATTNDSLNCATPYPFWQFTQSVVNLTAPTTFHFHFQIGTLGVWDWQMGLLVTNSSTKLDYQILLSGDPTYNAIEGPVVGTFADVYGSFLGPVYAEVLLYLGGPFYFVLLVYVIFKRRERTRQETARRAQGPTADDTAAPTAPTGPSTAPVPTVTAPPEGSCPNCSAVVYPGEKTCWKCGANLTAPSGSVPLPSGNQPG